MKEISGANNYIIEENTFLTMKEQFDIFNMRCRKHLACSRKLFENNISIDTKVINKFVKVIICCYSSKCFFLNKLGHHE